MSLSGEDVAESREALGQSDAFMALQERVSRAAKTDRPVILIGERGTGKELAAARLHLLSRRWKEPYATINCSSLTESLVEAELFGHEAGAFTGAVRQRKGRFEAADLGTLFLDEIATLPLTVQEKILRVVEYGQMERVGSSRTVRVDVRLVAATNVDLRLLAREGRFRQDLLDRLSFEVIVLPPLRERSGDIMLLANHFARRMAVEMGMEFLPEFSSGARRELLAHGWPGNVRELKNVVERAVYRTAAEVIEHVPFDPFEGLPPLPSIGLPAPREGGHQSAGAELTRVRSEWEDAPLAEAVLLLERERLLAALRETAGHQRRAATLLGLTYDQFRGLYRKHRTALSVAVGKSPSQ